MNSGKRVAILLYVTSLLLSSALLPELLAQNSPATKPSAEVKTPLREGWSLQSSSKVEAKGEVISTTAYAPTGWSRVTVPTTVVAALVKETPADWLTRRIEMIDTPGQSLAGWRLLMMMLEHEVHHRSQIDTYAGLQGWPVPDIFGRSAESIDALQDAQRAKHVR